MGDQNQFAYIKKNIKIISGPVLEIGSKNYGTTPDFRILFPDYEYIGIDMILQPYHKIYTQSFQPK